MRGFHWSEKGFWYCRSRNSFAQGISLWFSQQYKHLVFFLLARANSNNSNWSLFFWKVRFYPWSTSGFCSTPTGFFLLYINDIQESSDKLSFYLFVDDTNILLADKNLKSLELHVNPELKGHVNPKIHLFLILCKKWRRRRIWNSFCPIRLILGENRHFQLKFHFRLKH